MNGFDQPLYRGYQLWPWAPNWTDQEGLEVDPRIVVLGVSGLSRIGARTRPGDPAVIIKQRWILGNRLAINRAHHFWMERRGRLMPVWMPTWMPDFSLVADVQPTDTTIVVQECGYAANMFGTEARRHIAFSQADNDLVVRRITAAIDNGDGTETLTLEADTDAFWHKDFARVSYCLLVRAESDSLNFEFETRDYATADISFVEVAKEIGA